MYEFPYISIDSLDSKSEIIIKEWQVIGPFTADFNDSTIAKNGFDKDFLSDYLSREDSSSFFTLLNIGKRNIFNNFLFSTSLANKRIRIKGDHINFYQLLDMKSNEEGYAYIACNIKSSKDRKIVLLSGSDNEMKMWINNMLIKRLDVKRCIYRYKDFTPVFIKRGNNLLLVKVFSGKTIEGTTAKYVGRVIVNISSPHDAIKKYKQEYASDFLEESLINQGDSLKVELNLYRSNEPIRVEILDKESKIVYSKEDYFKGKWVFHFKNFKEGIYTCKMIFPFDTLEQLFYCGDMYDKFTLLRDEWKLIKDRTDDIKINVEALFIRYRHLLNIHNRIEDPVEKRNLMKKMVYIINELENVFFCLEKGVPYFKLPGTHIRGFRSKIDGQIQHYLIHVTELYNRTSQPMPLLIIVPPRLGLHLPFLKNFPLADINFVEWIASLGDKYGYMVLWPSARSNTNMNIYPICTEDIFETLEHVRNDFKIDANRIYLHGSCSGARSALLLATHFPSKFACVSIYAPVIDLCPYRVAPDISAAPWIKAYQPINFVENLYNIPIYILHSDADEHSPFSQTLKYVKNAEKYGLNMNLNVLHGVGDELYPRDSLETVFKFYREKEKVNSPKKIIFSTSELKYNTAYWLKINRIIPMKKAKIEASISKNHVIKVKTKNILEYEINCKYLNLKNRELVKIITNEMVSYHDKVTADSIKISLLKKREQIKSDFYKNKTIEGPILHAFADNFLVVGGTIGSNHESNKLTAQINKFREKWREEYFGDCKYKTDVDVDSMDIDASHLLLFGNENTNSIIKQIIDRIPLQIESTYIKIGNKYYYGNNLGIHMIYPNPLNPNKYVVIIGADNVELFQLGEKNLSLNGLYDYSVWKYDEQNQFEMIDAGYFNSSWH